jgi:uncharacterized membrane protein
MFNKKWLSISLIVVMFILAFYFQTVIPKTGGAIVTSVDVDGKPLKTGSRFANIFALPILAFAVYLLLNSLPNIAVYKKNLERFYKRFYGFKAVILMFLLIAYLVNLMPAFGFTFNSNLIMIPALAILFVYIGHVLKHIHRNYFIGILTPWALSSDKLWDRTHKFGGAVLEICGILLLVGLVFQSFFLEILVTALVSVLVITGIYSYMIFTRSHHHH